MFGFETKEEAIEVWNTWKGRYIEIDPKTFCEYNPCNAGSLVINEEGRYEPLNKDDIIGESNLLSNGGFTVPWPRLTSKQAKVARQIIKKPNALEYVFSLCARWCALFPSVIEYRKYISELLKNNDEKNKLVNEQLKEWNQFLSKYGFAEFEENDLRGINLSGLGLEGEPYSGIYLKNIDLSFSELSVAQLCGVNLCNSKLIGMNSVHLNLSFSICGRVDFSNSFISNGHFEGSDLSCAKFQNSMCHKSNFDGSTLYKTDFSNAQCTEVSICPLSYTFNTISKKRKTKFKEVVCSNTDFSGACIEGIDWQINMDLKNQLESRKKKTKEKNLFGRVIESAELKPNFLGLGINLKKLFRKK